MKIGHVTATYLPVVNGVTMMVSLYKKFLEAAGHQVTVFTLADKEDNDLDHGILRSPGFSLPDTGYYLALRYSKIAQDHLAEMDVIHCHHPVMGLEFCHRYGQAPIVFTIHTRHDIYASQYMKLPEQLSQSLIQLSWPRLMKICSAIIAPSASAAMTFQQYIPNRQINVVNNGIEVEKFQRAVQSQSRRELGIPQDRTLLICSGRLAGEKNLGKLLSEFRLAAKLNARLHLILVGNGPARKSLENTTKQLDLTDRISFTGYIPNDELPAYLTAADIYVTASLSDTLPLTVIEAMAAGLPVVAIKAPGIIDLVVDRQTGLLASAKDGGLAQKILFLAENPTERIKMGEQAAERSQLYHFRKTARQTLDLYMKLLSKTHPTDDCGQERKVLFDKIKTILPAVTGDRLVENSP